MLEDIDHLGPVEQDLRIMREHAEAFSGAHRLIGEELDFVVDLDQWDDDTGNEKSIDRIQPRDQSIWHVVVYKRGVALKRAPIHISVDPIDDTSSEDAEGAEYMKHALEFDLIRDRTRNFKSVRRTYVGGALMARAWSAAVDYDPEEKRLRYRSVDPRSLTFTPSYLTPHDPDCPVLQETFRMPISVAKRKGWRETEKLKPDDGVAVGERASNPAQIPGTVSFSSKTTTADVKQQPGHELFTGLKTWYRHRPPGSGGHKTVERQLKQGERFFQCTSCKEQSPPEGQTLYPDEVVQGCPECGGDLKLVTHVTEESKDDRLLRITAPFCGAVLYEGPWPVPDIPSFPYLWLVAYDVPHKAIGPSDVSQNWTVALAKNATLRLIWEQAVRSKPYYMVPAEGLRDYRGLPFDFTDENGDVIYNYSEGGGARSEILQAAPVSASLFALYDKLEAAYKRYEGTSDVAIAPGESKDIPVGTLEQMIETGNVPIDDFVDLIQDAESMFFTIIAHYLRATLTPEQVIRWHEDDGQVRFARLHGSALPVVDVTVSSGPSLDGVQSEKIKAYMTLVQTPPQYRRGLARFMRIDASVIQQIEKDDQEFQNSDPQAQQMLAALREQRIRGAMGGSSANVNGPKPEGGDSR